MQSVLRLNAAILPGRRIEITSPELPESGEVEVLVMLPPNGTEPEHGRSVLEYLDSLPPRPRLFKTAEEVDRYIQEERNSWDG